MELIEITINVITQTLGAGTTQEPFQLRYKNTEFLKMLGFAATCAPSPAYFENLRALSFIF